MGRILVADDEPHARRILERRLVAAGHEVVLANDGLQALELLREQPFDVLVTDICMPRMSGRELIEATHEASEGPHPITFVLTSRVEDEFREWLSKYQDVTFMEKPVSLRRLINKVEERMAERKSAEDSR